MRHTTTNLIYSLFILQLSRAQNISLIQKNNIFLYKKSMLYKAIDLLSKEFFKFESLIDNQVTLEKLPVFLNAMVSERFFGKTTVLSE